MLRVLGELGVSGEDYKLCERALEVYRANLYSDSGAPWGGGECLLAESTTLRGMWCWDTAFHAIGISRFDVDFAARQLEMFMQFQRDDGMFYDAVFCDGRVSAGFSKPPLLAYACELTAKRGAGVEFLQRVYDRLLRNVEFWQTHRCHNGLFYYDADPEYGKKNRADMQNESGWDNSVRWDGFEVNKLWAIDLNCYMVMTYRSMAYIAGALGIENDFAARAAKTAHLIEERLWDGERGSYADRCFEDGRFSVLSPAGFMPLYIKTAPAARAERLHRLACDPDKFFPSMPTVAFDDPGFGDFYWRGPVWLNTAYFAAKGLLNYGYDKTAQAIKDAILGFVRNDEEGCIHENYNARTGEGLSGRKFSWSAVFTVEFILEI